MHNKEQRCLRFWNLNVFFALSLHRSEHVSMAYDSSNAFTSCRTGVTTPELQSSLAHTQQLILFTHAVFALIWSNRWKSSSTMIRHKMNFFTCVTLDEFAHAFKGGFHRKLFRQLIALYVDGKLIFQSICVNSLPVQIAFRRLRRKNPRSHLKKVRRKKHRNDFLLHPHETVERSALNQYLRESLSIRRLSLQQQY
jgi:hypothetical protein